MPDFVNSMYKKSIPYAGIGYDNECSVVNGTGTFLIGWIGIIGKTTVRIKHYNYSLIRGTKFKHAKVINVFSLLKFISNKALG